MHQGRNVEGHRHEIYVAMPHCIHAQYSVFKCIQYIYIYISIKVSRHIFLSIKPVADNAKETPAGLAHDLHDCLFPELYDLYEYECRGQALPATKVLPRLGF